MSTRKVDYRKVAKEQLSIIEELRQLVGYQRSVLTEQGDALEVARKELMVVNIYVNQRKTETHTLGKVREFEILFAYPKDDTE